MSSADRTTLEAARRTFARPFRAAVKTGEFHDLRRTAICNWFAQGLSEYEIMKVAGHADFKRPIGSISASGTT
jgi:hypothetical protein